VASLDRQTSPLNYFLWSYLKNKVYTTKSQNIYDLCCRILNEAAFIPRDYTGTLFQDFTIGIAHCQTVNGEHFENLL